MNALHIMGICSGPWKYKVSTMDLPLLLFLFFAAGFLSSSSLLLSFASSSFGSNVESDASIRVVGLLFNAACGGGMVLDSNNHVQCTHKNSQGHLCMQVLLWASSGTPCMPLIAYRNYHEHPWMFCHCSILYTCSTGKSLHIMTYTQHPYTEDV